MGRTPCIGKYIGVTVINNLNYRRNDPSLRSFSPIYRYHRNVQYYCYRSDTLNTGRSIIPCFRVTLNEVTTLRPLLPVSLCLLVLGGSVGEPPSLTPTVVAQVTGCSRYHDPNAERRRCVRQKCRGPRGTDDEVLTEDEWWTRETRESSTQKDSRGRDRYDVRRKDFSPSLTRPGTVGHTSLGEDYSRERNGVTQVFVFDETGRRNCVTLVSLLRFGCQFTRFELMVPSVCGGVQ